MKHIIVGTNRPDSRSLTVAKIVQKIFKDNNEEVEIIELNDLPLAAMDGSVYSSDKPQKLIDMCDKIDSSDGLVVIAPEYNGSMPGILKYFIDHMTFPKAFEFRPVTFIGLGGRFGGLRPVEHLQHVFGYRNAFIFPIRTFLINVWSILTETEITEEETAKVLVEQITGFQSFVEGLKSAKLHANQK